MLEERRVEAQQVLDELFKENLLPFKLSAARVESIGPAAYIVHFHDSRLLLVDFSWRQDLSFKDVFRASVLERAERMGGWKD